MSDEYKLRHIYGEDYGTSDFKFGPIACGERSEIVENRGYFPDKSSIMYKIMKVSEDIIVGKEIPLYLEAKEDLSSRLIYPMKNGIIAKDDEQAWRVVHGISNYGLGNFKPTGSDFQGFYAVASITSVAPRYMYEKIFTLHREIDEQQGLVKAVTIIPQPLAVAIAHKILTCVVIESGHGNTQVCPISHYPIRGAIVAINRGGGDSNALTREILRDCGFGDLTGEEAFVRKVKENVGLVPIDLERAIRVAKAEKERFRARFKMPGTRIEVDLAENSWARFLIGEYVFNPNHEIFQSYFRRGMQRPTDTKIGDTYFRGMLDFGDAIIESVEKCPAELQPYLYQQILLSGGNFAWSHKVDNVATDSTTKVQLLLKEKGIEGAKVTMTEAPQYSVWRGCIVYGYAVPEDYKWNWEKMEGWKSFR